MPFCQICRKAHSFIKIFSAELTIAKTEPGVRGDTVKSGGKPATLETGATIRVPLFIEQDEKIRIDTRTGEYLSRV